MANERAPRKPRTTETRKDDARDVSWEPASVLPDPEPQDGWVFRWIRTSMVGSPDNTNVSKKFREGWEPVKADRCRPSITAICGKAILGCQFSRLIVKLV